MVKKRMHLMLCAGTGCASNKCFDVKEALQKELHRVSLDKEIEIVLTGCNGFCTQGPIMVVQPDGTIYRFLTVEKVPRIVEEHFLKGCPVKEFIHRPAKKTEPVPKMSDIPFFNKQRLIVLKNRGLIGPEKIGEYIAKDGYKALLKALTEMTSEAIIDEIKRSGLRGRGGAGFPTGVKWELCRKSKGSMKYIICNGDEGDPGAFMDRSIFESDPHAVLEGMIIGAKAIGARQGYIYIRDEYPLAVQRIKTAVEQARYYGLLGENIFDTSFDFDIDVIRGGGAFVCGEETALMASIEGKVGRPRSRPPFPAEKGLWSKPTNINNVETWANIPSIILRGATWLKSLGTEKSKGTKIFSLVGKIQNSGLVEVPMGITLREIIFEIGGGIPNDKRFKAVQTGGPSGGCIPESLLDLPVDYEALTQAGTIMGSGGLIVMDEDTCMVDVALYFVSFLVEESCGKCTPCRVGLQRMKEMLIRVTEGEGGKSDIKRIEDLACVIHDGSLCGLGQTAPNPVLTTLKYFRDEYEEHIENKRCPARVCKKLIIFSIDPEKCTGCGACVKGCPVDAISGERKQVHRIDQNRCSRCGSCNEVCSFDAVIIK